MSHIFHYAFLVLDLPQARKFYGTLLGCREGRSTESWIDFDFFGNQISCHLAEKISKPQPCGSVDGISVPIPHFGAILPRKTFDTLTERLKESSIRFLLEPQIRYEGQGGEQVTMFFEDPFGNPIELKSFKNLEEVFSMSTGS